MGARFYVGLLHTLKALGVPETMRERERLCAAAAFCVVVASTASASLITRAQDTATEKTT